MRVGSAQSQCAEYIACGPENSWVFLWSKAERNIGKTSICLELNMDLQQVVTNVSV